MSTRMKEFNKKMMSYLTVAHTRLKNGYADEEDWEFICSKVPGCQDLTTDDVEKASDLVLKYFNELLDKDMEEDD